jgi:alkylated DNA repair protein (DNA oxidative demethylase)
MMQGSDLFAAERARGRVEIAPGAVLLRGFALDREAELVRAVLAVAERAAFRNMYTPGGFRMSVAMTNCGPLGWVTDAKGYRYEARDPESGEAWPAMPAVFVELARGAAAEAGFGGFDPDACLINRYEPGARMTLHQDRDEKDFSAPIVSVSLGLPAVFQFGGLTRKERPQRMGLESADVVVWGGEARLAYHGVLALKEGEHAVTGRYRYNLTFRRAG